MKETLDRASLKLFGGLLMAAAVLGGVVNGLHPITTGDLTDTAALMAGDGTWVALHTGIVITMVLLIAGLSGVTTYTEGTPGGPIARVAMIITIVGGTLAITSLAIDGVALKVLADAWAQAPSQDAPGLFEHFATAKRVNNALWGTTVLVFFGIAIVTHGLAALASNRFPIWVGWGALLSGTGSVAAALIQLPSGGESRTGEFMFLGSSILLTIWLLALGYIWWRESTQIVTSATPPGAASALPDPRPHT